MKYLLLSLSVIVSLLGCGTSIPTVDYTATPEATSAATDLAELTTSAADSLTAAANGARFSTSAHGTGFTRVVNGDTGTATFTWEHDIDANGRTRSRIVTFDDFTKHGKAKLSHIEGQLIYTFSLLTPSDAATSIVRTLEGRVTATRTKNDGSTEQVVLEPSFTYTRDPATKCVHITGWLMWNNTQYQFQDKTHCFGSES